MSRALSTRRGPECSGGEGRALTGVSGRNSCVMPQLIDHAVQLPLRLIDLRGGFVDGKETGAHRDGHLVQVLDVLEDLFGEPAESEKPALCRACTVEAKDKIPLGEGA